MDRVRNRIAGIIVLVPLSFICSCTCWPLGNQVNLLLVQGTLVDESTGEPLAEYSLKAGALFAGSQDPEVVADFVDGATGVTDEEGGFTAYIWSRGNRCNPPVSVIPDELLLRVTRSAVSGEDGDAEEACEVDVTVSFADPSTYEESESEYGVPIRQILEPIQVPACGEE
jgi:hypothetical protein